MIMAINKVKINSDIELKDRLVAINRVTKVTKGGRTFTFSAIVVVGNENGIIGWGLGKAGEVTAAIAKGVESAKKNLVQGPVAMSFVSGGKPVLHRSSYSQSDMLCQRSVCQTQSEPVQDDRIQPRRPQS